MGLPTADAEDGNGFSQHVVADHWLPVLQTCSRKVASVDFRDTVHNIDSQYLTASQATDRTSTKEIKELLGLKQYRERTFYAKKKTAEQAEVAELGLFHDGLTGRIAASKYFENLTLVVITLNALWIGIDLECNDADTWVSAHIVFQIADNFFCVYFSLEVIIRFLAYRSKVTACSDWAFIFDTFLVLLMVFETWILVFRILLAGNPASGGFRQLSVFRLLRLLRLTRMLRLMRAFPEFMTLVKGLVVALRSVASTLLFLLACLWIFAIIFVQRYKSNHEVSDSLRAYFARLGISMVTLFINGTLLDDLRAVALELKEDSYIYLAVFFFFVITSSLTLLNMLIGVLSQVVQDTADEETENMTVWQATETLKEVFQFVDHDRNMKIGRKEFERMLKDPRLCKALTSLGIQEDRLRELSRQLFEDETVSLTNTVALTNPAVFLNSPSSANAVLTTHSQEAGAVSPGKRTLHGCPGHWYSKELPWKEFIDELLSLKPGKYVCVRDIVALRRSCSAISRRIHKSLTGISEELQKFCSTFHVDFFIEDDSSDVSTIPEEPDLDEEMDPALATIAEVVEVQTLPSRMIDQSPTHRSHEAEAHEISNAVAECQAENSRPESHHMLPGVACSLEDEHMDHGWLGAVCKPQEGTSHENAKRPVDATGAACTPNGVAAANSRAHEAVCALEEVSSGHETCRGIDVSASNIRYDAHPQETLASHLSGGLERPDSSTSTVRQNFRCSHEAEQLAGRILDRPESSASTARNAPSPIPPCESPSPPSSPAHLEPSNSNAPMPIPVPPGRPPADAHLTLHTGCLTKSESRQGRLIEVPTQMIIDELSRRLTLYKSLQETWQGGGRPGCIPRGDASTEWSLVPWSGPGQGFPDDEETYFF